MKLNSPVCYLRTTELEAEAMVNEGGAIRQPTVLHPEEPPTSGRHATSAWRGLLHDPTTMFWTGFATGLAFSLLERHSACDN
ncbi:MAG: hypothetical protein IAE77_26525 [Prosthecobacter sp.]|jgi:hypothetical protein|uniref:hypothetical protein n=1 Tax=Prosthecobacter sp. TaxID=1965333 RepID=UPI001A0F37CA|nr:hypothetical protein [Prosthecobacter sp.]MBE2287040.1 hypothetical protein [Prosthecobacter sp.]